MPTVKPQPISGWGKNFHSRSARVSAANVADLQKIVAEADSSRGLLPVGLHRSYGDSALNSGGTLIDMVALNQIEIDPQTRIAIVGGGVSISELESAALKLSLFPPVVPGTGFVTMGGAIAADIHGKSHHKTGSFSQCVRRISLLLASGKIADFTPTDPEFWATVGGLGLTGIVLEVEIELRALHSNSVDVAEHRVKNLSEMITLLDRSDADYEHTVAWIDLSGDYRGRGVVSLGNYGNTPVKAEESLSKGPSLPALGGKNFITSLSVKAFNEIWFRKPLKNGPVALRKYMHPLDGVGNWNRIYGNSGFLQYQFVIDIGQEEIFEKLFAGLRELKAASFLGVLKKFGAASQAPLSFPRPGWTLTLDYSVEVPGLEKFLRNFDEELVSRGGRIYLIKDSRLDARLLPMMYPELNRWREIRSAMDPDGLWQSDQARRLHLC
jgi:decaprenylphospho-beta-D-ribofuranose 2-oxidase